MSINELYEKRAMAVKACRDFLNTHTGTLSAEEKAKYSAMENDISDCTERIQNEEKLAKIENELNQPVSQPVFAPKNEMKTVTKAEAFDEYLRNRRGEPLKFRNLLQESTDAAGGYTVPDEFERTLVQALADENLLRKECKIIRTSSGDRAIPIVTQHGAASWLAENGAYVDTAETFSQKLLGAKKLTRLIKVSEELLYDSAFDLKAYISNEFARSFGEAEEDAIINGATNGLTGLLDNTEGSTLGVTAASKTAITADEVIDLTHALRVPYRKNAKFLLNDATLKLIRKLKDTTGNYIWQPGLQAGQPDTLLGYPVLTSVKMPTMAATTKVVLFGDFSNYWIAERENISMRRLEELYAANGQVGFKMMLREDGKLILQEAVKHIVTPA